MTGCSASPAPLTATSRARLFSPLAGLCRVGIAVSGGPDSTALLVLFDRWKHESPAAPALVVLTVDHGLRPEAAREADAVVAFANRLGHPAEKLVWRHDGPPPVTDIQAEARTARYRLLVEAAHRGKLDAVLLAHTRDDQAETLLMHLARGSGVAGLSGMPAERTIDGVRFLRPLLDVTKADLVALLDDAGIPYVSDPSNASDRYTRVRFRKTLPAIADLGLTAERLAGTARRMARAEAALQSATDDLALRSAVSHGGIWSVDTAALAAAPDEIGLRLIVRLIRAIRPSEHPPRADAPEGWHAAFRAGTVPRRATMAGVVLHLRSDRLWLYAEAGRTGFPELVVDTDGDHVWDNRFAVSIAGAEGRRLVIAARGPGARSGDMPAAAAASLPTVRAADGGDLPAGLTIATRPICRQSPGASEDCRSVAWQGSTDNLS
ncbi:tRNA lysidine(34) synthetase TilS [Pleomorphomonas sp. NRK KF1]|uniref:tRNA lysidine(34) synthetase TilS n=1 Tax=Pleomorphomonas sp. NRK KF1 TaxID=2943000 RepID=UPI00204325F1|nr:tRNA lysidine(34) synthetase TilS [Pleomorphomonas sp. NRK KF1]MCM5554902.1 tRNA lysidine(34) synthetase TilS [Pleomorphomonas sp. NRK KF1]